MTVKRNLVAEEMAARTHWVVEGKIESNSQAVVAATNDHNQRVVEARIVDMENAVVEMVASNSVVFEERTVNRGNAAVVEKLADNWSPPGEKTENN